jgi:putative serine protease PepD
MDHGRSPELPPGEPAAAPAVVEDGTSRPEGRRRRIARKAAPLAAVALVAGGAGGAIGALAQGGTSSAASPVVASAEPAAVKESTVTAVYKEAAAGVVEITVDGVTSGSNGFDPFGGQGQQQTQGEGSGFVLDNSGHIVTNDHVVEGATSITVHFSNGKSAKATLVGTDPSSDVAVLKVDVDASELTPLTLGDSSSVEVGQGVVAIGSPFGLENSVTAGIVSAVGRQIQAPNGYTITGAIQTDASINPGNSGGPLFDAQGRVIGVNAQIESSSDGNQGVGFAIPINTVKSVAEQLLNGGTVAHAYLGVQVADATSGAGAAIASVQSGSPAASAGLKAGDVVTAVNGNPIGGADDLTTAISSAKPGEKVELTVDRGGNQLTLTATLATRPS